jgi:hypothetical protein
MNGDLKEICYLIKEIVKDSAAEVLRKQGITVQAKRKATIINLQEYRNGKSRSTYKSSSC